MLACGFRGWYRRLAMSIVVEGPFEGRAGDCEPILRALPDWFGIEEATAQYVRDVDSMPTFVASVDGVVAGFVTVNRHFDAAAEIHVIGVRPEHHRQGIGAALMARAETWLRAEGVEYVQVKTVGPSSDDPFYARTRQFYAAMGYRPLEEIKTLWDERNPCLIQVKRL